MSINLVKTPRKSSSLLIFSSDPSQNQDYQLLFLKRKGSMSFANVLAFPGGVFEAEDQALYTSIPNEQKPLIAPPEQEIYTVYRITALRETYEETGLFFINPKVFTNQSEIQKIIENLKEKNMVSFEKLVEKFGLPLKQLVPLMRFITIQQALKRYDTMFYAVFLNNNDIMPLNIGDFIVNNSENSLFSIKNLQINLQESDLYRWLTPKECYEEFLANKISLAPPQILQLGHLNGMDSLKTVEKFYKEELKNEGFMEKPQFFPFLAEIKKKGKNENYFVFPGDDEYEYEKIGNREECEELKKEIIEKNRKVKGYEKKKEYVRALISMGKEGMRIQGIRFEMGFVTPLDGLKNLKVFNEKAKL